MSVVSRDFYFPIACFSRNRSQKIKGKEGKESHWAKTKSSIIITHFFSVPLNSFLLIIGTIHKDRTPTLLCSVLLCLVLILPYSHGVLSMVSNLRRLASLMHGRCTSDACLN